MAFLALEFVASAYDLVFLNFTTELWTAFSLHFKTFANFEF